MFELNESGELIYDGIPLDRISKVGLSCAGYLVGRRDSHMPLDRQLGTISLDIPNIPILTYKVYIRREKLEIIWDIIGISISFTH